MWKSDKAGQMEVNCENMIFEKCSRDIGGFRVNHRDQFLERGPSDPMA
jgi:hypothetical protein